MPLQLPSPLIEYCRANGYGEVRGITSIGGGCINNASRLDTDKGPLFLKINASAPPDMFEREAEGLTALATAIRRANRLAGWRGPQLGVPRPLRFGPDFILQEFVESVPAHTRFWELLGLQLALLHQTTSQRFGFAHDNYIGLTRQINTWEVNGYKFFAEQRLLFQADLAQNHGRLDFAAYQSLLDLLPRLPSLVPAQPASLIHGDLWSGNIHTGPNGQPVLIDPAAHYGWAEAELAMMTLFGSPPEPFFKSYESVRPLAPGYRERFDLYNLYHLLNHLNLFGGSYLGSVLSILRRYQ